MEEKNPEVAKFKQWQSAVGVPDWLRELFTLPMGVLPPLLFKFHPLRPRDDQFFWDIVQAYESQLSQAPPNKAPRAPVLSLLSRNASSHPLAKQTRSQVGRP